MPVYIWTKELAILITKKARYYIPAIIAAGGAVGGFIAGWFTRKKTKAQQRQRTAKQCGAKHSLAKCKSGGRPEIPKPTAFS